MEHIPLHLTVVIGNKEIVQFLLDNGAKIDLKARNKDEATPLLWAPFFAQKKMVPLLIESEVPMNVLDANNYTSLDSALLAWKLNEDDERTMAQLMEIITVLRATGGTIAYDLKPEYNIIGTSVANLFYSYLRASAG